MNLQKNKLQILITLLYLGCVGWWFSFQSVVQAQGMSVQRFGYLYGILAFLGALVGLLAARHWGGYKTVLGKALLFFALGLLAQEAGQLILAYYIYVSKIQIPYPSWGDVAYFGSTLFYICGGYFLTKAAGVRYSLKSARYRAVALLVPAALLLTSFFVFLHHHQYDFHKPVTAFLDFGYPVGDALYISLALLAYLLSRRMLGGIMRAGILILILAMFIQYIADFSFLYQSSRGTYLAGQWVDLTYLTAYFVTASAMVKFNSIYNALRDKTTKLRASAKSGVDS